MEIPTRRIRRHRFFRLLPLVAAVLVWLLPAADGQGMHQTLRSVLAKLELPEDPKRLANLDKTIAGAELDDPSEFVIAYYLENGSRLEQPAFVHRYDKQKQTWSSTTLYESTGNLPDTQGLCYGAFSSITPYHAFYFLAKHLNPSAECLTVLTRDLNGKAWLYGWFLAGFGERRFLYHHSQIHFAPVHALELGLYDLVGHDSTIFPPKGATPIRTDLIKRLAAFFSTHQEWCRANNHPCDIGYLDSGLAGDPVTNPEGDALAFVVSYDLETQPPDVHLPVGPKEVLYVYRNASDDAKREFREIALEEAKREYGAARLQDFLERECLERIFARR